MTARTLPSSRRRGVALLFVLGAVIVLAAVATGLHDVTMADWRLGRREVDRVRAQALARTGLELTKELLRKDTRRYFWVPDPDAELPIRADGSQVVLSDVEEAWLELARSRSEGMKLDGAVLEVEVTDEAAFLNLNRAPRAQLVSMLQSINDAYPESIAPFGAETQGEAIQEMVSAIIDWRDPDGALQPSGAEAAYYQGLTPMKYLPRNGAFQAKEELLMVRDVTPGLLYGLSFTPEDLELASHSASMGLGDSVQPIKGPGLADLVTVHGLLARVNANTASAAVLAAQPGIQASPLRDALVAAIIVNRPHTTRLSVRNWMQQVDPAATARALPWLDVRTEYVRIISRGRVPGIATFEIEAVVREFPGGRIQMVSYRER